MAKETVLIVEDDRNISKLVKYNLEKNGYTCAVLEDGDEVFRFLEKNKVQLIILDIMLPGKDGFEICRAIKQNERCSDIPVMMLTARGEEVDRIVGLELGAEDYIVKPFSPRELVLRVKAVLKRRKPVDEETDKLSLGSIRVDVGRYEVFVDKKKIELTPMEFKLLVILLGRAGRVQSREKLLSDVWDISSDVTTRTVDTHIKRLREKLGKAGDNIETVRGLGYKLSDER
ncbi:MAG TPA: response regulator transcription factor [Candidatus Omnitrophota bacterium]|nr:response regulator transcription factor [Candidatus Omnitrophota bacterium]HPS20890.1 response regulator transcription factor [Candidatus Omnitrophota bacterium]